MNRRQLTFQTCTQGWCWCTPPRSERTARPAVLQPPGGGGDQAPFPPPPGQLIGSNTCTSGAPGAVSPEGAAGKALAVDDFGCLPPPSVSSQVVTLMRVPRGVGAEEGAGQEAASTRGKAGGGARLGHPDCDLGLKDFPNGLGVEKAGDRHGIFPSTRVLCHSWDSPSVELG